MAEVIGFGSGERDRCRSSLYTQYGITFVSDASVAEALAFKLKKMLDTSAETS